MEKKRWIQDATKHKGSLHRNLGIPLGTRIPKDELLAAAKKTGQVGAEARLALTLGKLRQKTRRTNLHS